MLEAGAGEGYGADMIADVARRVVGVDPDLSAVEHIPGPLSARAACCTATSRSCRCPTMPLDVVVNFQVIEHLWDQGQFLRECARVLRPGGELLISHAEPDHLLPRPRHPAQSVPHA